MLAVAVCCVFAGVCCLVFGLCCLFSLFGVRCSLPLLLWCFGGCCWLSSFVACCCKLRVFVVVIRLFVVVAVRCWSAVAVSL